MPADEEGFYTEMTYKELDFNSLFQQDFLSEQYETRAIMLKLAWRNIWRNKVRSTITIAAVMFCVIFAVVAEKFSSGVWEHMVDDIVANNFGYLQVHQKGFWEEQSLDLSMDEAALP